MTVEDDLYLQCVYTILPKADLERALSENKEHSFSDSNNWMRAKQLLVNAKKGPQDFPIVFSTSEDPEKMFAC